MKFSIDLKEQLIEPHLYRIFSTKPNLPPKMCYVLIIFVEMQSSFGSELDAADHTSAFVSQTKKSFFEAKNLPVGTIIFSLLIVMFEFRVEFLAINAASCSLTGANHTVYSYIHSYSCLASGLCKRF